MKSTFNSNKNENNVNKTNNKEKNNKDLDKSNSSDYSHFNVEDDSESELEFPDVVYNRTKNLDEMKNQYYDFARLNLKNNGESKNMEIQNKNNLNKVKVQDELKKSNDTKKLSNNYDKDLKNIISKFYFH